MEHALITTIIASIVTAFVFGLVAKKLDLPGIFGYLLAGVAIGPYTPGFVANVSLAQQLAEIGIILLITEFGGSLNSAIIIPVSRSVSMLYEVIHNTARIYTTFQSKLPHYPAAE